MIVNHYQLESNNLKELLNEDHYLKKLKDMRKFDEEPICSLMKVFDDIINKTFDQYEGLRQISDFRGLPDGDSIIREGNQIHNVWKKLLLSAQVLILENARDKPNVPTNLESNFDQACNKLLVHFHWLKVGILKQVNQISSLRTLQGSSNLNCVFAYQFMNQIWDIATKHLNKVQSEINVKLAELAKFPDEQLLKQLKLYTSLLQVEMVLHASTSVVMPWVEQWINVQVPGIILREIFATDVQSLNQILQKNMETMVLGFQELLTTGILDLMMKIEDISKYLTSVLENLEKK